MSFIHCSPLFTPLMPLPIMSPEVTRDQQNKGTGSMNSTSSSMRPPSTRRKTSSTSTKAKGKQPATSSLGLRRIATSPPSQLSVLAGPSHPYESQILFANPHSTSTLDQVATTQLVNSEHETNIDLDFSYPENLHERPPTLVHSSSHNEGSYNSQDSAALTLTVESQPMSDLSSSQQHDS